jgi:hypothetical protein
LISTAPLPGMELTDNLMAFVERKLFTLNTGHAITAYLGKLGMDFRNASGFSGYTRHVSPHRNHNA